jgi:hypothetical protein
MQIVRVHDRDYSGYDDNLAILYRDGTLQMITGQYQGDYWSQVKELPDTFSVTKVEDPREALWNQALAMAA